MEADCQAVGLCGFFLGPLVGRSLSTWTLAHFSRCGPESCCEAVGCEAAFYSLSNFPVGRIVLFFLLLVLECVFASTCIYMLGIRSLCVT